MENASKALLMAGGILLVMLIVGLIMFARLNITDFYRNQEELKQIDNITEFNKQFTNYNKEVVHGYELISLANKVADYNMRYSNAEGAKNDEKYNPITLTIKIPNSIETEALWYDNTYTHLFKKGDTLVQSSIRNDIIGRIVNPSTGIEKAYGDSGIASKLAKSINVLILTDKQIEYNQTVKKMSKNESENAALENYKKITKDNSVTSYSAMVTKIKSTANIYQYYEYYQFKRGIFKCTGVTYDNYTQRVSTMNFEFTGKIE